MGVTADPFLSKTLEWNPVSRSAVTVWLIKSLPVTTVLWLTITSVVAAIGSLPWTVDLLLLAVVVPLWGLDVWVNLRRWRNTAFAVGPDELFGRTGSIFVSMIMIPYGRIQNITVTAGPLKRAFGLCDIVVVTAGANHLIPCLSTDVAERLRAHLLEASEKRAIPV